MRSEAAGLTDPPAPAAVGSKDHRFNKSIAKRDSWGTDGIRSYVGTGPTVDVHLPVF